jgi:hypothetical protein
MLVGGLLVLVGKTNLFMLSQVLWYVAGDVHDSHFSETVMPFNFLNFCIGYSAMDHSFKFHHAN